MRKNPQYGRFPNRVELGRPRAASRKSMAIGGGERKWRNAVCFASNLAAAAGVELSVYRRDRRWHGIGAEELVQVWMGNVPEGPRWVAGMVRVFVTWGWWGFSFFFFELGGEGEFLGRQFARAKRVWLMQQAKWKSLHTVPILGTVCDWRTTSVLVYWFPVVIFTKIWWNI